MGLDDIVNKAKDLLDSDQAEEISDKVLDGAADAANKATGGKFEDQVGGVRDIVDGKIGNA